MAAHALRFMTRLSAMVLTWRIFIVYSFVRQGPYRPIGYMQELHDQTGKLVDAGAQVAAKQSRSLPCGSCRWAAGRTPSCLEVSLPCGPHTSAAWPAPPPDPASNVATLALSAIRYSADNGAMCEWQELQECDALPDA